jgi:hypothetical protein
LGEQRSVLLDQLPLPGLTASVTGTSKRLGLERALRQQAFFKRSYRIRSCAACMSTTTSPSAFSART